MIAPIKSRTEREHHHLYIAANIKASSGLRVLKKFDDMQGSAGKLTYR